jgi:hypothetical protein
VASVNIFNKRNYIMSDDNIVQFPTDRKEPEYQITPKGALFSKLQQLNSEITFEQSEELWKDITEFVRDRAISEGFQDGIPCLVLDEYGTCMNLTKKQ